MAILPLQLARVSNSLRMSLAQRTLTRTQQSLLEVQNQIATGKRLTQPSDNPGDASVAMQLRKTLEQQATHASNLRNATYHLSEVDSTLGDLTDLLRQALTIASTNASSTVSADARTAASSSVSSLLSQALSLGNKQHQGTYLFGGDRGTQAPFVSDLGGVRFVGSDTVLLNTFGDGVVLPFMADANQVFGALSTPLKGSTDLAPAVTAETRLADLAGAGGQGVRPSSIILGNGEETRCIDLSQADTIGDVMELINAAGVGDVQASIAPSGRGLVLSGGPADLITVKESGGTIAKDLGVLTTTPVGPAASVEGPDLGPRLTALTRLDDLRAGQQIDRSGLIITNGQKTVTIDLQDAQTVEDLLNAINGAGVGVLARINSDGTGIDVLNAVQGSGMSIAENGGETAAQLGIRSFSPASLLKALNGGSGVHTADGDDLEIARRDGTTFTVDLGNAATIQDVIDAINAADGGGGVSASFSTNGNGIVLTDGTGGSGSLSVKSAGASHAAEDLGLNGITAEDTLAGRDVNAVTTSGVFGNLARLRDALTHNDQKGITAAAEAIQADLDRVVRTRGQVGAQVQEFEMRQERIEDQKLTTQSLLSLLEDTDYNEAITRFQTLQTALQANLQTTGSLLDLSLLDFLK